MNAQKIPAYKINDLEALIDKSEKPMIVNFWATFCIPCIEEIPYFIKKTKEYEKHDVSLLLVSLDMEDYYPAKIKSFALKQNFAAPLAWLNETDADLFCPRIDKEWSGAIPATLFVNNKTGYRKFFEDQLTEEELDAEIKAMLN
ncbi:MAG: TlpA family protein disulfide reductase [Chitinophagaceae bacterium]|nr:TlpA family protein disulfide reductase [Chitinophagaceae bacterium]